MKRLGQVASDPSDGGALDVTLLHSGKLYYCSSLILLFYPPPVRMNHQLDS